MTGRWPGPRLARVTPTLDPTLHPLAAALPVRLAVLDAQCDRIADRSFTIAMRIIGDAPRAESLVLATFMDALGTVPVTSRDAGRADSQLLSVVRERALALAREARADGAPSPAAASTEPLSPIPMDMMLPRGFDVAAFRGAFATLSDRQREAIDLVYYAGLSQLDVARRTGLQVHSVMRQLRLALLVLHRAVEHMDSPAP